VPPNQGEKIQNILKAAIMKIEYVTQPDDQLGKILSELLDTRPKRVIFVSAFVALQTIMRLKNRIAYLRDQGVDVRFVFGIDLGGTSQEVLKEILSWHINISIVKHRIPRHIFHPKLYFFEWETKAEIILGSNNLTEGGFFRNYEGFSRITYQLPDDLSEFQKACADLERFINPTGPIVYALTEDFLRKLIARNEVPTEAEAQEARAISSRQRRKAHISAEKEPIFGVEEIAPPPPLSAELLERLIVNVRNRRRERKSAIKRKKKSRRIIEPPILDKNRDALFPAAFYMTLPTLQGINIPGEARIPLEAIEIAKEFWGWPDEYKEDISPRSGKERIYWNWRPTWRVYSIENPRNVAIQQVRMYMYTNSSDFRFYARPLLNAGANLGDIVRIKRIAEPEAEYECILARRGTPEYKDWLKYCTQAVRNSSRRFGYA
jgi:HKD family nuclease